MDGFAGLEHNAGMSILTLLITLIVIGVLLWLVNTFIPMQGTIKRIINALVVICVVIWLLQVFGVIGPITGLQVPRFR
jgi:hypothetical protein